MTSLDNLRGNIEAGLRLLLKSERPLYRQAAEVGITDLRRLFEQLEAARKVISETAERVHLVLDDHYSGRQQERVAALPAYGWLTTVYEYEDENHDGQIRPVEEVILAVHGSRPIDTCDECARHGVGPCPHVSSPAEGRDA